MKMGDDEESCQGRDLLDPPRKPSPVMVVRKPGIQANITNSSRVLLQRCWGGNHSDYAALSVQLEMLKQHRQQKQQGWTRQERVQQLQPLNSRFKGRNNGQRGHPPLLSCAWLPLQGHTSSTAMRAVFRINNSGSKRECSGTGVFLPKRTGCSTLPARLVQALNLNIDGMDNAQPSYYQGSLVHEPDGSVMLNPRSFCGRNGLVPPQRTARPPQLVVNGELQCFGLHPLAMN